MPISALWTLVISFFFLALGLALKTAALKHTIDLKDEEMAKLRSRIEELEKIQKEPARNPADLHPTTEKKKTNRKLDLTGVFMR